MADIIAFQPRSSIEDRECLIDNLRKSFGYAKDSPPVVNLYPTLPTHVLRNAWDHVRPHHTTVMSSLVAGIGGMYAGVVGFLASDYRVAAAGAVLVIGGTALGRRSDNKIKAIEQNLYERHMR